MSIGSAIKDVLKTAWKAMKEGTYMDPSDEIRTALEEKGYQFEHYFVANNMGFVSGHRITSPEGERIYCAPEDPIWEQYKSDYIAAEKALEAAKAASEDSPAPRPPEP